MRAVAGSGTASFTTPTQPQGLDCCAACAPPAAELCQTFPPRAVRLIRARLPGTPATVAALTAAALIVIAAWVVARRRRRPAGRPSAAYCAQHPEDPLCTTA